jgi:hypothetical protein
MSSDKNCNKATKVTVEAVESRDGFVLINKDGDREEDYSFCNIKQANELFKRVGIPVTIVETKLITVENKYDLVELTTKELKTQLNNQGYELVKT